MAPRYCRPLNTVAHQRDCVTLVMIRVDDLVILCQDHQRTSPSLSLVAAESQTPPCALLPYQWRVSDTGHEGGDKTIVVVQHPLHVADHTNFEGCDFLGGGSRGVGDFGEREADRVRRAVRVGDLAVTVALATRSNGLLQFVLGDGGKEAFRYQARGEDEASDDAEVLGSDEAGGCEQNKRGNKVREGDCEVHGYTAAETVPDEAEGVGTGPGQIGGGERQEHLRGVETCIMR